MRRLLLFSILATLFAPRAASQAADTTTAAGAYRWEVGGTLLYRSTDDGDSHGFEGRAGVAYTTVPLVHDEAHRTMASKAVLRTAGMAGMLGIGGFNGPQRTITELRVSGADLVDRTLALGGAAWYRRMSENYELMYDFYHVAGTRTWSDFGIGPLLDIFASPSVRLRESVQIGAFAEGYISDGYGSDNTSQTLLRVEHTLNVAGSHGFGYTHGIQFTSVDGRNRQLRFDNTFEIAPTSTLSIVPVVGVGALWRDGEGDSWLLSPGMGVVWYPSPRVVLSFLPRYHIALQNAEDDPVLLCDSGTDTQDWCGDSVELLLALCLRF
jgi:hypothetical protein